MKNAEAAEPVPEAPKDVDVARELLSAAMEGSGEFEKNEESETATAELVRQEETEPTFEVQELKIPEVKRDTYNELMTENKKIICELTQLRLQEPQMSRVPKTITAFTEEQLAALYRNTELEMVEDFTSNFIEAELKGIFTKQHPLYELLMNYLRVREKVTCNTLEFNQLRKEYQESRSNLWTIEKNVVSKQGQCQDGVKVAARQEFDKATFHRGIFQTLVRILGNVQELTNNNHVLYTFSAEDLKIQVNGYNVKCCDNGVLTSCIIFRSNYTFKPPYLTA